MSFAFKLRRGLAVTWTTYNPVLSSGEPGLEVDTNKLKIGDGVHAWIDLPYFADILTTVVSVDGRAGVVTLADLYAAIVHTHAAGDVTSGTFEIAQIPTGTTSSTVALGDHTHAPSGPTITVASVAPSSPAVGDVWIDTSA